MATKKSKRGGNAPELFAPAEPIPPQASDAVELVERNLLDYALYVIGDRAVPSVADGLKPVARRLLWGALNGSPPAVPGRPTVKCARVTGETMAKYHPHGDSYLALVRMAQPFALRAPLFEFQGNYGSPDFGPAASRYTETRLSPVAMALLAEVRDGTVDLVPNYDGLELEPEVLPAGYPNLLVNGSYGIAFGMASHFPTHNPGEVCAAARHLISNPKATVDELLEIMPGPDYPDPCTVVNGDELSAIYRSGTGQIRVRGIWTIEESRRGERLIVTSLPYVNGSTGSSEEFIRGVVAAVEEGKLAGVDDIVNESAKGATRIAIDLGKGVGAEQIIPALLRHTNLQVTNPVRMHALDTRGVPQMYNLRTALEAWIGHRVEVVERRSRRRIEAINERLHLLDALLLVLLDIDAAIAIIRAADDAAAARVGLMERFGIDEIQANYVLDLTLRRLTRLARVELEKEQTNLRRELARLEALVASPGKLRRQVGTELDEVATMFAGIERHTEITTAALPSPTIAIPDEPMELVVLDSGYVQAFKATAKARAPKEGVVLHRVTSSTATHLVVLTETGQLYRIVGASFPTDKPTAAVNVVPGLLPKERVLRWDAAATLPTDLLLVTSGGTIKRIADDDLAGGDRKGGISIVKLESGERLVAALPFHEDQPVVLLTAKGQAIRFVPADVRPMGRSAAGVRGIKLADGDSVIGAAGAPDGSELVIVHTKGGAKRTAVDEFPIQGRAGKGVRAAPSGGKHGDLAVVATTESPLLARRADGTVVEFPSTTAVSTTRDAAPAKIRGFEGVVVDLLPAPPG